MLRSPPAKKARPSNVPPNPAQPSTRNVFQSTRAGPSTPQIDNAPRPGSSFGTVNRAAVVSSPSVIHTTIEPLKASIARFERELPRIVAERDEMRKNWENAKQNKLEAVNHLRSVHHKEKTEWRDALETLNLSHLVRHQKTMLTLANERLYRAQEIMDLDRSHNQSEMEREYRLHLFASAEYWNQVEIKELKETIVSQRSEYDNNMQELRDDHDEALAAMNEQIMTLQASSKEHQKDEIRLTRELAKMKELRIAAESAASRARDLASGLNDEMTSLKSQLERCELKLASAQTELADKNVEVKKWHKLDKREEQEMNDLRSQKVDLEIRVKELEERIKAEEDDTEERWEQRERQVKKEQATMSKQIQKLESELNAAKHTIEHLKDAMASLNRQSVARKEVLRRNQQSVEAVSDSDDDPPPEKPTKRNKSTKKAKATVISVDNEDKDEAVAPKPSRKALGKQKARDQDAPVSDNNDAGMELTADEVEEPSAKSSKSKKNSSNTAAAPRPKPKPKPKAKPKAGSSRPSPIREDSPIASEPPSPSSPPPKAPRKRKAVVDSSDQVLDLQSLPTSSASTKTAKGKFKRTPSGAVDFTASQASATDDGEPKKKKKRILGGASMAFREATANFGWEGGDDAFSGIPNLSPVVESVPARAKR